MTMEEVIKGKKVFVIAEAGVNHNGSLELAKKLVDAAQKAGSDAVKFQTFKTENLLSKRAILADYQKRNSPKSVRRQFDLIKKLELSFQDFKDLSTYCERKRILFLSTPFDFESADMLEELRMPIFKLSSGEITNLPFLRHVARKGRWMILSTGMSTMEEVRRAVKNIHAAGNERLILLHCVTDYPAAFDELNLRAIQTLKKTFNVPAVGFSDHTLGVEAAVAAVALGAGVIEKHLTLNIHMDGPDHRASLDPLMFQAMVSAIRNIEKALGDGIKQPSLTERKYLNLVRKSIIASCDIHRGEILREELLVVKRPGYGISPNEMNKVIGRKILKDIKKDDVLRWEFLR